MSKPDYAFKASVLNEHDDLITITRKLNRFCYLEQYIGLNTKQIELCEAYTNQVSHFLDSTGDSGYKILRECSKINDATYHRTKRLRERIESLIESGPAFFLTLTFTDYVLNNTTPQTRRRYVTRFLQSVSEHYVANIDFGEKNGREHYHAVCVTSDDAICMDLWNKYGFFNAQRVRSKNDSTALSKYVAKLTNHAIKDTTKGTRMIYSK